MASIFVDRKRPEQTVLQQKESKLAWKPNSARIKLQQSGPVTVIKSAPKTA